MLSREQDKESLALFSTVEEDCIDQRGKSLLEKKRKKAPVCAFIYGDRKHTPLEPPLANAELL